MTMRVKQVMSLLALDLAGVVSSMKPVEVCIRTDDNNNKQTRKLKIVRKDLFIIVWMCVVTDLDCVVAASWQLAE